MTGVRGSLVTVVAQGDYGKPRPAVIIQSDLMEDLPSVVVCPVTSTIRDADFRLTLQPSPSNGLKVVSQVMADKVFTVKREKLGTKIGSITPAELRQLERCLAQVIGLADP